MAAPDLFDSNTWYRIVNSSTTGLGYALDVVNNGTPNPDGYVNVTLNPVDTSPGQYWRLLSHNLGTHNSYILNSMWLGEYYYLGVLALDIAMFSEPSMPGSDYYWNVTLLNDGTFSLIDTQMSLNLHVLGNGAAWPPAWAITKVEPVSNDTSATVTAGTGVSTPSSTCSNPSCTPDATTIIVSPLPASSSIQTATASSIASSSGNLDASTISQSIAFATFPLTTQSITPSRAADPTSSAPTTALTPNGKPATRTAVGIGVGAAIGGLLLCGFVVCIFMRRRRRALANHDAHGTENTMPCHTEAKPELSAQEQQCAEPSSKLPAQDSQCAEPTSKLSTQDHQSAELSGDQGTMPPHTSGLGGPYISKKLGSNNSTLLELE